MKEMWNKRYAVDQFVYGTEPNQFFKETLDRLEITGKMLFPAEGEGRNAVYAAKNRADVYAYDISSEAKRKALTFAEKENVRIDYQVGDIEELNYADNTFDAAVLVFAHFPPNIRTAIHKKVGKLIKPGGIIILEGFSVGNLIHRKNNPSIGGPDKAPMLFTNEIIKQDFKNFDPMLIETVEVELNEGSLHKGKGEVVRFIGRKIEQ